MGRGGGWGRKGGWPAGGTLLSKLRGTIQQTRRSRVTLRNGRALPGCTDERQAALVNQDGGRAMCGRDGAGRHKPQDWPYNRARAREGETSERDWGKRGDIQLIGSASRRGHCHEAGPRCGADKSCACGPQARQNKAVSQGVQPAPSSVRGGVILQRPEAAPAGVSTWLGHLSCQAVGPRAAQSSPRFNQACAHLCILLHCQPQVLGASKAIPLGQPILSLLGAGRG